jgi:hypothetical protein
MRQPLPPRVFVAATECPLPWVAFEDVRVGDVVMCANGIAGQKMLGSSSSRKIRKDNGEIISLGWRESHVFVVFSPTKKGMPTLEEQIRTTIQNTLLSEDFRKSFTKGLAQDILDSKVKVEAAEELPCEYDGVAPKPVWEPKVGDWVTITKPTNLMEFPGWHNAMDDYLSKPHKIHSETAAGNWNLAGEDGFAAPFCFNPKWLSPWEPKVGDWVTITKPEDTKKEPGWVGEMDKYLGKAWQIVLIRNPDGFCHIRVPAGDDTEYGAGPVRSLWAFHKDWMTPAQPKREDGVSAQ